MIKYYYKMDDAYQSVPPRFDCKKCALIEPIYYKSVYGYLFYVDIIMNTGMYEDYLINEIVPLTDNTIKNRNDRYIGGASAGGYTALHNAFRHQNMFSKAGRHMPAIELKLEEDAKPYFKDIEAWKK